MFDVSCDIFPLDSCLCSHATDAEAEDRARNRISSSQRMAQLESEYWVNNIRQAVVMASRHASKGKGVSVSFETSASVADPSSSTTSSAPIKLLTTSSSTKSTASSKQQRQDTKRREKESKKLRKAEAKTEPKLRRSISDFGQIGSSTPPPASTTTSDGYVSFLSKKSPNISQDSFETASIDSNGTMTLSTMGPLDSNAHPDELAAPAELPAARQLRRTKLQATRQRMEAQREEQMLAEALAVIDELEADP